MKNDLREKFLAMWRLLVPKLPPPELEYRFHPIRKWRFDMAWPEHKLAIEIDGGSFVRGGHNRGAQQHKDHEKQNVATSLGWRVLRFATKAMDDPHECVRQAALVLCDEEIEA